MSIGIIIPICNLLRKVDIMSDPNKPDGKTKIITELKSQPPRNAPNTDEVTTQLVGLTAAKIAGKMTVVSGDAAGTTRPFYDGTNSIGRDPDQNLIGVEDSYISRTGHAILTVDVARRKLSILDGGKPNRVQVNGQPIDKAVTLKATDTVQLGRTIVRFELV